MYVCVCVSLCVRSNGQQQQEASERAIKQKKENVVILILQREEKKTAEKEGARREGEKKKQNINELHISESDDTVVVFLSFPILSSPSKCVSFLCCCCFYFRQMWVGFPPGFLSHIHTSTHATKNGGKAFPKKCEKDKKEQRRTEESSTSLLPSVSGPSPKHAGWFC